MPDIKETAIKLFEEKRVRILWDDEQEKWFFSIIDVVGVLSESTNLRKYWSVFKTRLKAEGSQLATNCSRLKMKAEDGKIMTNLELVLNMLAEASDRSRYCSWKSDGAPRKRPVS